MTSISSAGNSHIPPTSSDQNSNRVVPVKEMLPSSEASQRHRDNVPQGVTPLEIAEKWGQAVTDAVLRVLGNETLRTVLFMQKSDSGEVPEDLPHSRLPYSQYDQK